MPVRVLANILIACMVPPGMGSRQTATPNNSSVSLLQTAMSDYESHQYEKAKDELQPFLVHSPDNFEANELMGLIYADQGNCDRALPYFKSAVRLRPRDVKALNNIAACLILLKQDSLAEAELKKSIEIDPRSYTANHDLGELYIRAGKLNSAMRYLQQAQRLNPSSSENGYDLAVAYLKTRHLEDAQRLLRLMMVRHDAAELHNLLGAVEERQGNLLKAAKEYERAASMDPSEENIFDWGAELLVHQTLEPAIRVFRFGTQHYPHSARMEIGLGLALDAHGLPDEALAAFIRAVDLTPADPRPYLFLAKAFIAPGNGTFSQAKEVTALLKQFVEISPQNPRARYYYALALWKGREGAPEFTEVKTMLKSALAIDPSYADAYFQLGNLYSDERDFPKAIAAYQQAIRFQPDFADAHYHLGGVYLRTGQRVQAGEQLEIFGRLHKQQKTAVEERWKEIRRFIYGTKEQASGK
jgi:tetratricopeptide (TPR) repeat protein